MLSVKSLQSISKIFCGDIEGFYSYKSGPKLVEFFNRYFNKNDIYKSGFPSRWQYVYDNLYELLNCNRFDDFLNIILSIAYVVNDCEVSQVQAAERAKKIYEELNTIVQKDLFLITRTDNKYHLCSINQDLEMIGSGGFANVYKQKSTGLALKKLKEDFLTDEGIRSRFKREYNITKSLQDTYGIITVFVYDDSTCSYTMELAEMTLYDYVIKNVLNEEIKFNCIRQVLYIMRAVHKKNIIHRDLSPNNIFVFQGQLKIADFGLGKDLKIFQSHQTIHTNSFGQYAYCAPEQFMMLKDGDKRSDVYSLGKIINFIMTKNPNDDNHIFRTVVEKATCSDSVFRFEDAGQVLSFFEKRLMYHKDKVNEEIILNKINRNEFDDDIENYIYEKSGEELVRFLLIKKEQGVNVFLNFMRISEKHQIHIASMIENNYKKVCVDFVDYDIFAEFAYRVLKLDYNFVVKEIAAKVLRTIAIEINRYSAQRKINSLIDSGVEPLIEDILTI
ncbi:MAG: serine/threonine protein kinase [Phascolarctobacterium sp.]|nr:serine/threonine protein kinase [Phascolarctobacterium sp.]